MCVYYCNLKAVVAKTIVLKRGKITTGISDSDLCDGFGGLILKYGILPQLFVAVRVCC